MDRTVARLNIEYFRRLLTTEMDGAKRNNIVRLLAEEEQKLVALESLSSGMTLRLRTKCIKCGTNLVPFEVAARFQRSGNAVRATTYFRCERCGLIKIVEDGSNPEPHEYFERILGCAMAELGASMGNIQLLDRSNQTLFIAAQRGFKQDFLDHFREVSAGDGCACGIALRANKRIIVEDVNTDDSVETMRAIARAAGFQAVQSTPLIGRDKKPIGMLSTHFSSKHRPSEDEFRRLASHVEWAAECIR